MVVPLYNRGYVDREEVLPYVLGANVGTFADTVVVALALDAPVGVAVVLFVVGLSVVVTLLALLAYGPYAAGIGWTHRRITTDRRAYVGFLLALLAVPLSLVVVPFVAAALA
jgi:sodium-dependent phosphate cotransporter